jgi:hypothetical protein
MTDVPEFLSVVEGWANGDPGVDVLDIESRLPFLSLLAIELAIGGGDDLRRNEDFEAPGEKAKLAVLPFLFEGEVTGGKRWGDVSCA